MKLYSDWCDIKNITKLHEDVCSFSLINCCDEQMTEPEQVEWAPDDLGSCAFPQQHVVFNVITRAAGLCQSSALNRHRLHRTAEHDKVGVCKLKSPLSPLHVFIAQCSKQSH